MLTRLHIKGFKNLVDTEVRFGPFTCIAGANGVGKSNLFDAIHFLSLLADQTFVEAARSVRGGDDLAALFTKNGDGILVFDCDILIPPKGSDDFNQTAKASSTFLNYQLTLKLTHDVGVSQLPTIRLVTESLKQISSGHARDRLAFGLGAEWLASVLLSSSRNADFISTKEAENRVRLHADRMKKAERAEGGGGRWTDYPLDRTPRTVLSSAQNAEENRTAVILRQEMRSWRELQLEPSALRRPDDLRNPSVLAPNGAHLPGTLFRLASDPNIGERVYTEIANRLAELVDGVHTLSIDRDNERGLLRLMMTDASGVELPAASLSDGTLRFIALSVLERDPSNTGVLCLEEPENGIHPQRVEAMVRLLGDMSVDTTCPVDGDNPLRQVIISTHSPVVVARVHEGDVLFARPSRKRLGERVLGGLEFVGLDGSWRHKDNLRAQRVTAVVSRAAVFRYLSEGMQPSDSDPRQPPERDAPSAEPRPVADALGLQLTLGLPMPGGRG